MISYVFDTIAIVYWFAKSRFYSLDKYNKQVLDDVGLSQLAFSQSGLSCLKTLSEVATQLNVKNCNISR